jgi:hypothetical protein
MISGAVAAEVIQDLRRSAGEAVAEAVDGVRKRLPHLRSGLAASAALLVLGLIIGGLVAGGAGAAGAAAGVGLVASSYVISSVALAWADLVNPRLVMPVGMGTYVAKFTLIGLVMAAIAATGWAGLPAMGVAVIASALGWTVAQAVWVWRARIPYVEIELPRDHEVRGVETPSTRNLSS